MVNKIHKIRDQISSLRQEIKDIQESCTHPDVVTKAGGDTGNWCPQDDCYWTEYDCPTCLKKWTVYEED